MCTPQIIKQTGGQNEDVFPRPLRGNERRENPDGTYSTELSMTEKVGNQFINFPSLYKTREGIKEFNDPTRALEIALDYEKRTGNAFPRFNSLQDALDAAQRRTNQGGTGAGALQK